MIGPSARFARWVRLTGTIVLLGAGATIATPALAAPVAGEEPLAIPKDIPEALRPWTAWVLHDHEQERCPVLTDGGADDDDVCVWAGRLALTLDGRGGKFTQDVQVFAPGPVALPGDARVWPLDVKVNGKPAVVVPGEKDGDGDAPVVHLPVGRHTLQGTFAWRRLPESLPVPTSTALLGLTLLGRKVDFPSRSAEGELFLQKQEAEEVAEEDKLDIAVHRHVADDVPMLLTTRLVLNVSGKTREIVLGKSLPAGFLPHTIDSPLPVRIESDGRLRVQLRPGTWTVTLVARQNAPVAKLQRPMPDGPWKDGDEVWVFAARPVLRTVTIEGVPTIDPQQTTLPDEWRKLPAYLMVPGATMALVERRRGNANPPADQLTLRRQLWLDFDGRGFTARDQIAGTFQRGWRLAMGPESKLGRVSVGGQDQFITRLGKDGPEGVEIRQTRASLIAESRIIGGRADIPAVGWAEDFQSASAALALPPGFSLVHASGADTVSETWIMRWTLLDLFLLLITGIGMGKVFGWKTGLLALITLGLVLPQREAPKWIWLSVLVAEALVRALPEGRLRWVARATRLGTWVCLVVFAIPFAVQEVRVGLHPALDPAYQSAGDREEEISEQFLKRAPRDEGEQGKMGKRQAAEQAAKAAGILGALGEQQAGGIADVFESSDAMGVGGLGLSGLGKGGSGSGLGGIGTLGGGGSLRGKAAPAAPAARRAGAQASRATQNLASYDPNVMVQTGPGVPRWNWHSVQFDWNGPVDKAQRLKFWLLPPWLNLVLGFARVILMAALVLRLFGGRRGLSDGLRLASRGAVAVVVLLPLGAFAPAPAVAADFPDDALLGKLRERLLEKADCHPSCASIGRLALEAASDRLRLRFELGAVAPAAVPLPGHAQHWLPDAVLVDGKPAATLTRADDGQLWLQLVAGSHQVVMEGPLPPRETVQIPFKMLPRAVTVTAHGWKVEGLTEDGRIDGNLQLSRIAAKPSAADGDTGSRKTEGLEAASLPPFVIVERTLELGLKWEARTRVTRQTAPGAAVVVEVPLLPGESVVTSNVHVVKGRVQVNLGAGETELSWNSTLAERSELVLEAPPAGSPAAASWSESWFVNASAIWHVSFAGIAPVEAPGSAAVRVPGWRPWPGEKVTIAISKPTGTAGQTLTLDRAALEVSPGVRSTRAELLLSLRSSRGGEHALTLPVGSVVDAVTVNGTKQPPRQDGRRVIVPIGPGAQTVEVSFREPVGLTSFFRTSRVELGLPGVNVDLQITVPADRWILMVGGPRMGPAVLFWSFVAVLILIGVALGRTRLAPLGAWQWILLGLGLSQTPPPAAALVAGALLAFGWRRRLPPQRRGWVHNLGQIGFAIWTIAAVMVLFSAIKQGLLDPPDMRIAGNDSHRGTLKWFADRTPGAMPQPWVLSVPLLAYRLVMLAWALWLALAVIRWARWVWGCFTHGDLWRSRQRAPKLPVPVPAPASEGGPGGSGA